MEDIGLIIGGFILACIISYVLGWLSLLLIIMNRERRDIEKRWGKDEQLPNIGGKK